LGSEYRGLEAKQAQIPQQLGHALVIERGLGRAYAELDLPSDSDLVFGAGLAETQQANRCRRNIFTQAFDLCGQPPVQILGRDRSVWMTTDCDLAHTLIVGGRGTRGNGCPYPFRSKTCSTTFKPIAILALSQPLGLDGLRSPAVAALPAAYVMLASRVAVLAARVLLRARPSL
jgi:hypothetical protein